uniref:Uncharacterized protein n=1 Tax=Phocoena sinus TaxID=42100 RepID=A0A8C9EF70_PHOSS
MEMASSSTILAPGEVLAPFPGGFIKQCLLLVVFVVPRGLHSPGSCCRLVSPRSQRGGSWGMGRLTCQNTLVETGHRTFERASPLSSCLYEIIENK